MRLWHQALIPFLDRQRLLSQHRECAALRGAGWGRKHATVDYAFTYSPAHLFCYHQLVMDEMEKRGYNVSAEWRNPDYRGKTLGIQDNWCDKKEIKTIEHAQEIDPYLSIYSYHDTEYLQTCINLLYQKKAEIDWENVCAATGLEPEV